MIIENGAAACQNWCGSPFSLFSFYNGCFSTKSNPDFYDRPDTCIPQFRVIFFHIYLLEGAICQCIQIHMIIICVFEFKQESRNSFY